MKFELRFGLFSIASLISGAAVVGCVNIPSEKSRVDGTIDAGDVVDATPDTLRDSAVNDASDATTPNECPDDSWFSLNGVCFLRNGFCAPCANDPDCGSTALCRSGRCLPRGPGVTSLGYPLLFNAAGECGAWSPSGRDGDFFCPRASCELTLTTSRVGAGFSCSGAMAGQICNGLLSPQGRGVEAFCVAGDQNLQFDVYQATDALPGFCSYTCASNNDCVSGRCVQLTSAGGKAVCVPAVR